MKVYILERIADADKHWQHYHLMERIAVLASNSSEARRVASASQPMLARQKEPGQAALETPPMQPWSNPEASRCRLVGEVDGARVLAVQQDGLDLRDRDRLLA